MTRHSIVWIVGVLALQVSAQVVDVDVSDPGNGSLLQYIPVHKAADTDSFVKLVTHIIDRPQNAQDLSLLGQIVHERAEEMFIQGAFHDAIDLFGMEAAIWKQADSLEQQCVAFTRMSRSHYRLGEHLQALHLANEALAMVADSSSTPRCEAAALIEIAWNNLRLLDYNKAIECLHKAEPMVAAGHYDLQHFSNALAKAYLYAGRLEESLNEIRKGLNAEEQEPGITATLIANQAPVYTLQGHYEEAIAQLKRANAINRRIGYKEQLSSNTLAIGGVFYRMGQLDSALSYITSGIEQSRAIGDRPRILYGYMRLADIYAAQGNFELAYEASRKRFELNDSLYGAAQLNKLASVEWERHLAHKQSEIDLLTTQKALHELNLRREKTIRNLSIGIIVLTLLFGGWLIHNIRASARRKQEASAERFSRELMESEMSALKAQMNPHFLFNTLNSIKVFIVRNEPRVAADYLAKFARLVRLTLQYSNSRLLTLEQEIEVLELYVLMETIRTDHAFESCIEVDDSIDAAHCKLPPMLLQPYVENAIWHGLAHKKNGKGHLNIRFTQSNGFLECIIEDDGVGRQAAQALRQEQSGLRKSLGMKITGDRIALINRMFEKKPSVRIRDLVDMTGNPAGTEVTVNIPLEMS
ncbi:MAG: histidine kinase [Saprospiraceae bacterium]|nr:histidine kinase [Saprospiraceae bacterium]